MSNQKLRERAAVASRTSAPAADRRQRTSHGGDAVPAAVNLKGLTGLAGYLIRQAQLWVFQDFNVTLAPLDLRPVQYSILTIIRERGGRGLPLEDVYRQLYNPALYLRAYGRIYRNDAP